ncbi:hypothetical protein G5V59_05555 [Nocardioides sp. W3-2-3]|uniref:hypothetical protein n=1 Tax=Nocardioides convexus TaxID=2712224 RepID=UPI0024189289|nr:hypothetical protein [Nocardioides convexus]NGZ99902.1 hypothetical protein [Nocardioides convexus]
MTNPAQGKVLADGAKLGLKDTDTAPTVENALAQASLLINGGGLAQLQTVTEELNSALNGNEGDYRTLLDRAKVFLTQANATSTSIDAVLNSLRLAVEDAQRPQGHHQPGGAGDRAGGEGAAGEDAGLHRPARRGREVRPDRQRHGERDPQPAC